MVQGFSYVFGVDFTETFTSTIGQKSLRIFLLITSLFNLMLLQIDVIDNYLQSILE